MKFPLVHMNIARALVVVVVALSLICDARGQDPTVPSPKIIERLRESTTTPAATRQASAEVKPQPSKISIRLKAIVLADPDHGSAILEVEGRRLSLQLDRLHLNQTTRIKLDEEELWVEDFSTHMIQLRSQDRTIIVR